MLKNKKGITLIALIITIIVLLILAGISISTLVGDNGVLSQASKSKVATEEAKIQEEVYLAYNETQTERSMDETVDMADGVQTILRKEDETAVVTGNESLLTVHYKGYIYILRYNEIISVSKDSAEFEGNTEISQVVDAVPGDITTDANGNSVAGTNSDPYQINSIEDLIAVSDNVAIGNTYENNTIKLMNSLNFSSELSYVDASATTLITYGLDGVTEVATHTYENGLKTAMTEEEGFAGIGYYQYDRSTYKSTAYEFCGVFDGNSNEIQELHIDGILANSENKIMTYYGLFNYNVGIVKNLGVTGNIKAIDTTEDSVYYGNAIGMVAYNTGIVLNCCSKIDINVFHMSEYIRTIYIGGIVGYDYYGQVYNCYNNGLITYDSDNRSMGDTGIGGIVGYGYRTTISNSYNTGDIYVNGGFYTYIGGIVGESYSSIKYCYNTGNIKMNNMSSGGGAGGISGRAYSDVSNCYNLGDIVDEYNTATSVAKGGVIGTVDHYYYLYDISFEYLTNNYCKPGLGAIGGEDVHNSAEQTELTVSEVVDYIRNKNYPYVAEEALAISDLLEPGVYVKYDTSSLTEEYTTDVDETCYESTQTFSPSSYTGGWIVFSNEDGKVEIIPETSILDSDNVGLNLYGFVAYKNCIKILQDACSVYLNETYGVSVRSLGYVEGESVEVLETEDVDGCVQNYSHEIPYADSNYYIDFVKLIRNKINVGGCYLASRMLEGAGREGTTYVGVRYTYISSSGYISSSYATLNSYYSGDRLYYNAGICPVIELKTTLQVTGGSGTQEDPYILE